jgi:hypothetical protein
MIMGRARRRFGSMDARISTGLHATVIARVATGSHISLDGIGI